MAYLQHSNWRDRPGAVIGVVAVHAIVGYALVTGLTFSGVTEVAKRWQARDYVDVPLPPPPPEPEPTAEPTERAVDPPVVAPLPPLDLPGNRPPIEATPLIQPPVEIQPRIVPGPTPLPEPALPPRPAFEPLGAKPKGNPANWVTVNDYRSSWINREMTGTARFRLEIAASGRVEGCTITSSSGHEELDRATCALLTQRARFDPARDGNGEKTGGSYSSAVRWELPD